jgi:CRISPR-associated endoribonuclease Cas6
MLQSMLYSLVDGNLADFLHSRGYQLEKRTFKLFTFSRLLGKCIYHQESQKMELISPIRLVVSSPIEEFTRSLAENLVHQREVSLNGYRVYPESINVLLPPPPMHSALIKMLSPLTTYSTLIDHWGKKKTYYYSPQEKEFQELLRGNLLKKYKAFYKKEPKDCNLEITSINSRSSDQKILIYKGTVIKGWMGIFEIKGSPELIRFAYEAGLGSKNSQGFGCFEILPENYFTNAVKEIEKSKE